eukprot:COSAG02_NODE_872_length_16321_cov_6.491062_11_plen_62_part_00
MGGGDILKSNIIFNMVRSAVISQSDPSLVGPGLIVVLARRARCVRLKTTALLIHGIGTSTT